LKTDEPEYAVSSDDEVFDVLFNQNLSKNKHDDVDLFASERK